MSIATVSSSFNVRSDTLTIWANYLNSIVSTLNNVISQINDDPSTYFKLSDISTGLSLINSKLKVTDVRLSNDNDLASLRGGVSAINLNEVSTDFNSLVNHGIYYTSTSTNTPESLTGGFFVLVLKKDTNIAQFAMHDSSNSVYFRFSSNSGTSFSDWNKCSSVTGNASVQGLVKLSDSTSDSQHGVNDGVAATPKAVNDAITELNIPATANSLGRIKVGESLSITSAGVLDVNNDYTNDLKALILDLAHPVGSYYWSDSATDPGTLFGGTWEQVKDVFILAAGDTYTAGDTGGSASHTLTPAGTISNTSVTPAGTISNKDITPAGTIGNTTLTVAQMPTHTHNIWWANTTGSDWVIQVTFNQTKKSASDSANHAIQNAGSSTAHGHSWTGTKNTHNHTFTGTAANHNHTFTGTQATINHMNPYIVAYCFKRIS